MKHVGKGRLFLNVSSVMMIVIVMVMGVVDVDDGDDDAEKGVLRWTVIGLLLFFFPAPMETLKLHRKEKKMKIKTIEIMMVTQGYCSPSSSSRMIIKTDDAELVLNFHS